MDVKSPTRRLSELSTYRPASVCVLVALTLASCRQPWYAHDDRAVESVSVNQESLAQRRAGTAQEVQADPFVANADDNRGASGDPFDVMGTKFDERTFAQIAAELEQVDHLNAQEREEFLADLREIDPDYWPQMLQTFRATIAFRQQREPRSDDVDLEADDLSLAFATDESPDATVSGTTDEQPVDVVEASHPRPLPEPDPVRHTATESVPQAITPALPVVQHATPNTGVVNAFFEGPPQDADATAYVTTADPAPPTKPPSDESWESALNRAIGRLEGETTVAPATSAEIADHARLRLLQLAAGEYESALVPIDGVPPAHQDYWSKLLFALSTHFDEEAQPDARRRAALSRHHLDAAADLLGELALLEVKNLAFCTSVRSFGIYEPIERPSFRAGDQVKLYAEVANYRSEPTEEGYRTHLATSYEVIDASGQRVDSGEFPQVEDVCRTRRQDFHIQYGVDLPSRIYPGTYRLQLTIEDMLSRKLGRASVEFEIVAAAAARK